MDFKIACVVQFIFSSCHLLFHFPSLCVGVAPSSEQHNIIFIQSTPSSIFPCHMKSLGYEDVLWMFTKHTCVCARVWNCLRCVPFNTKCAMRKAVETNGLTAVSIDLGGTTHVALYLLHRESSHIALSLTAMSVKHTLCKLSTTKILVSFWRKVLVHNLLGEVQENDWWQFFFFFFLFGRVTVHPSAPHWNWNRGPCFVMPALKELRKTFQTLSIQIFGMCTIYFVHTKYFFSRTLEAEWFQLCQTSTNFSGKKQQLIDNRDFGLSEE